MKNMKNNKIVKQQKGFSLIELSMVISVIALLLIIANFAFTSIRNNIDVQNAVEAVEFHMVTAVQQCQNRRGGGDLRGCNTAAVIAVSPISSMQTPWGNTWTIAVPSGTATSPGGAKSGRALTEAADGTISVVDLAIKYPFTGAPDASSIASDLAIKLNAINGIKAASSGADLFVDYAPRGR